MAHDISFDQRVDQAVHDTSLQEAVHLTQDRLRTGRIKAAGELDNVDEWRQMASDIRSHTIENLDSYLEQFADNVEANGGHIHIAVDDKEAVTVVNRILKEVNAQSVVKSKSMVAEEIHLNESLEASGVKVTETDLGEYIIQLADEKPSHIIAPAIHKTRKQVTELFSKEAGYQLSEEAEELCDFARGKLRQEFLQADVGISGCNFAVAESGSVVLVENEGNIRLTTSLPKTHIVLMGMERIVPGWKELDVVLSMLPRSATGQRLTTYVTAVNSARQPLDVDGPENLHVVIIDNGRSDILGTAYEEVLKCIRCGACINVCPIYRHIGGHAYGSVYNGPIGAVLSPLLDDYEETKELPFASSLCGACTDVCPVKIPLHELLIEHRKDEVDKGFAGKREGMTFDMFGKMTTKPWLYAKGVKWAHAATKPFSEEDEITKGPSLLREWTNSKSMKRPPNMSFREWWERERKE
ncbi:LutB/LldF family L-lactate oxidation iron-sulfur protein [Alteribacillus iranensis]|uniref:L-lactate dehydrogenase complex protein LldF n=1 Tax=Alteribacillus iranensis TaxID=930128 RepID=A0A1I2CPC5_9BACI|nr:LutB/LldF family L-lactate oxidation iron-sulfur protein [Alteribacillus iranensis]SFE69992.1 L-lactate dehydrogenase complex protein LldF [Alteribacillus iranensis]